MRWRYRDTVLALSTAAFFATMAGRLALSPVVPDISATFDVSTGAIGLSLTGMWAAYALAQYPSGVLAERYGERVVIMVAVGGTAATTLLIVAAPTFAFFVLGTVLLGGTAGLHFSVATALLARTYDDIGTAVGVHNGGAPIAGLVTPVAVAWIAVRYGWRPAVAITVPVAVAVLGLFAWRVHPIEPRRPTVRLRDRVEPGPIRELLSRPAIAFTVVVAVLTDFAWQALASFLPTFLVVHRGYSATLAGSLFAAYFVVQGVLQVLVGRVSDRYGRDLAIAGCMLAGIVAFWLLVAGPGIPAVAVGIVLLGFSMGMGAAVIPRFMDRLGDAERTAGFGLVRTVYMIVAATGSAVVGLTADAFGWAAAFGVLTAVLAAVLVLLATNEVFDLGY